ncbi:hypothetical protein ACIQAC_27270 [Streptomyces sp. NPDC088387]|uniref:hypothetical protein n=1 Tax=Streptomyces sp. NPDC088387 TaxID=3365859 RepID=UPI0038271A2E
MIRQITHSTNGTDPASYALALEVATELHGPRTRAPELAPGASRPGTHRVTARRSRTLRG